MKQNDFVIRAPWPDELPRLKSFMGGFQLKEESIIRIALAGSWERVIGVAIREESDRASSQIWLKLRPRYMGSTIEQQLRESVSAVKATD
ncbi:MAG: hypothetical protein AAF065_07955 [Verrucomicrobiota bacterium]